MPDQQPVVRPPHLPNAQSGTQVETLSDESQPALQWQALPAHHPRTLVHLLSCLACREAALGELLSFDRSVDLQAPPATHSGASSPGAVAALALSTDRAATSLALPITPEAEAAITRLVDTLEHLPAEHLSGTWKASRYNHPEVLEALLSRGERALRTEAFRSERLGLVALFLAGKITDDDAWVPPGVVRSGLLVGAARRLQGKLKAADQAFQQIAPFLESTWEVATYSREVALLRWQQGRSGDAAALLAQAAETFAETGRSTAETECWGLLGLLRREEADLRLTVRARSPLLRSLDALRPKARPTLALRVRLALVLCEAERGEQAQARALLEGAWSLVTRAEAHDAVNEPRLAFTWTEGRLLELEGKPREAEQALLEVRASQMAHGRLGEAALASLDLALVASQQDNLDRAESLADELAFRFKGDPGLVFALQALADFEESLLSGREGARAAHALASRFLRQSFRARGLAVETPPFP